METARLLPLSLGHHCCCVQSLSVALVQEIRVAGLPPRDTWLPASLDGTAPTLEEVIVSPQAEAAIPHVEGIHHGGQQPVVLKAPRQNLQNERLLLGAQSLEEKQTKGGYWPDMGTRGPGG